MYTKDKNLVLNLRVSRSIKEYLELVAREYGCSLSEAVRVLVLRSMISFRGACDEDK